MALSDAAKKARRQERMRTRTQYAEQTGISVGKQTEAQREAYRKERLRREEFTGRRKADPKDPNKPMMYWMTRD